MIPLGRLIVHLAALFALGAMGLAIGGFAREPSASGLLMLGILAGVVATGVRWLYREGGLARPAAPPRPGRPEKPAPAVRASAEEKPLWSAEVAPAPEPVAPVPERPAPPARASAPDPRVDVNRATLAELQTLPGIGPVAAQRIIDEREAGGPFKTPGALTRVPGLGPAKVRMLAPSIRV